MTSWTLYYKSQNETSYTSVEVTENPFTLTDLNPMTGYTAYLVTNCESEESVATSIVSFETACSTVDIYPYSYGFETEEFLCWTNQTLSETQEWNITESQAPEGSKYAKYQASSYSLPSARLISPIFDLSTLTNPYVKFTHKSTPWGSDIDELKVQYRTSPAEEWVDLVHYTIAYSDWTIDSLALPNSSEEYQIAFLAISHYGYGVCLDAITVYDAEGEPSNPEPEPCDAPTALSASNITETTAEITWVGTAEAYEFKLNSGEAEILTATSNSLTDLTPNTTYTVEVRAVCGEQTSEWVSTSFTTLEEQVVIELGQVTTSPATEVGNTSATLNGTLVSAGNSENIAVGFALAIVADFTLEDAGVQNIPATLTDATFSQAVTDLAEGQTYFFRAYITNEAGTAYGAVETFTLSSLADALANQINAVVYPNPATTQATLQVEGLTQDAKIVISDLQGRILSQDQISAGENRYTINVSDMASGVYYIRIVTDAAISTQKLIVE